LRFAVEGLKCCLGVKRKESGRKAARFLLRGLSSPGPPNRAWASPFNPWNSFLQNQVGWWLFPQTQFSIIACYATRSWKVPLQYFHLHLFGRHARAVVSNPAAV